jgi:hypothetical protein
MARIMLIPDHRIFASSGIVPNCPASAAATTSVGGRSCMKHHIKTFLLSLAIPAAFAAAALAPGNANAQRVCVAGEVCAGYDLFETLPGTFFDPDGPGPIAPINFEGLELGTFDFGGGAVDVGTTDTIVQRLDTVSPPSGTTDLVMLALQLISVDTYDANLNPDPGGEHVYITLDDSVPSTGTMTIDIDDPLADFNNGTFDSTLNVAFNITLGSPGGQNLNDLAGCGVGPCVLELSATDVPWDRTPPLGAQLIEDINYRLDVTNDIYGDIWAHPFIEEHPCCGQHEVTVATVPEPGTLTLLGATLLGFAALRRRMSRRSA